VMFSGFVLYGIVIARTVMGPLYLGDTKWKSKEIRSEFENGFTTISFGPC
jgi:hypothetical protein